MDKDENMGKGATEAMTEESFIKEKFYMLQRY